MFQKQVEISAFSATGGKNEQAEGAGISYNMLKHKNNT